MKHLITTVREPKNERGRGVSNGGGVGGERTDSRGRIKRSWPSHVEPFVPHAESRNLCKQRRETLPLFLFFLLFLLFLLLFFFFFF